MAGYFAGRYYKHQKDGDTLCFILGRAGGGKFLQIIANDQLIQCPQPDACYVDDSGLTVDLPQIRGRVEYGPFTPLHSDIMGPFRFAPMQCRHEVISMGHALHGGFVVNGRWIDLNGGTGYIEGDRGRSFPREYLWLHCNDFPQRLSIMASVAHIPLCGLHFMGCICAVIYKGKEYRLATYRGVDILAAGRERLALRQGPLRLEIEMDPGRAQPLKAPKHGVMTGTIHESNCTRARFCLWEDGVKRFDLGSENCSFECNLHDIGS